MTNEEIENAAHEYACRNGADPEQHGYGGVYRATTSDFKAGAAYVMERNRELEAKCERYEKALDRIANATHTTWHSIVAEQALKSAGEEV